MKKQFIFLFTILILLSSTSFSQVKIPGITIGASLFYSNPQGSFKNSYKGGVGGEIKGGVGFGKSYLVASVGYATYQQQSDIHSGSLLYKPIKLGIKHYLLAKRFFLNADVGMASLKDKSMTNAYNSFSYDYGGGVRILGMEAGVFYNNWNNINGDGSSKAIEFKVGYNFTL